MLRPYLELPRTVYILCLGTFVNRIGSFFLVFVTIYLGEKMGFGARFATACLGVFGFGSICGALMGGQLADQIGRRTVMLISLFCGSMILATFPFITSQWLIVIVIFSYAAVMDMYRPAASAMISDVTLPAQRGIAYGLMYIAINLGFACGAGLGGMLASFSFVVLFLGDAASAFTYGLIVLMLVQESRPTIPNAFPVVPLDEQPSRSEADHSAADVPPAPRHGESRVPMGVAMRHILRDAPFLLFCFGCLLAALVFMQSFSTLPLYFKSLNFKPSEFGWIISLNGAMIAVIQVPLTAVLTRFERVSLIAGGSILLGIGFGLVGFARTGLEFAGTVVIWTFGELMQAPFTQAVIADVAPISMRARYMGVFTMCFSSAMMIGAPIGGVILERFGGRTLWTGCFITCMISFSILIIARPAILARRAQNSVFQAPKGI